MNRIPALDGIRAIAILAVLGHHSLYGRMPGGFLGVDLFFVLSGFLITSLLAAENDATREISLRGFYTRRALRILPPLPIAIVLAVLLGEAKPSAGIPVLLFVANYVPDPIQTLHGLAHTWSLSVEEHFYFVWPLLFIAAMGHRRRLLICVVLAALACRVVMLALGADIIDIQRFTHTRMDSLAIGCLAALLLRRDYRVPRMASNVALVLICASFLMLRIDSPWMLSIGFTAFACLCAAAIAGCSGNPLLEHPVMRYIGQRSYGLYLYHAPIFLASEGFRVPHSPTNFILVRVMAIGLTFLVAEISFRTVERWARTMRARQHQPA